MGMLDGKTVLLTGATNGIGRVCAERLAREGADLFVVARDRARGERTVAELTAASGNPKVTLLVGDLGLLADVRRVAAEFRAARERLHLLVNNAGAINMARSTTRDGNETTFAVNHLAYYLLTRALLDVLVASAPARVVVVSSGAHRRASLDLDDLQLERRRYNGWTQYSNSKLMNLLFARALDRRLAGTGVTVNSVHPGFVRTGFAQNNGLMAWLVSAAGVVAGRTPEKGAEGMIRLCLAPELDGVSGRVWCDDQPFAITAAAQDDAAAERLWELSARSCGLEP